MDISLLIERLIPLLSQYGILISFIGGLFAGEEVIATLSFLSAQGYINIWVVFIFCFIGILICDLLFFSVGKFRIFSKFSRFKRLVHFSNRVDNLVIKITKKSTIRALLYTKFIFGTRILTLVYLGFRGTQYKDFLKSDFIVGILWMVIVVSIGWFAGASFRKIIEIFANLQLAFGVLILFVAIIFIIFKIIENKLAKEIEENGSKK